MAQGKGILQPHDLIDELEKVITDNEARQKLSEGPFGEVLKSAQVCSNSYLFSHFKSILVASFSITLLIICLLDVSEELPFTTLDRSAFMN